MRCDADVVNFDVKSAHFSSVTFVRLGLFVRARLSVINDDSRSSRSVTAGAAAKEGGLGQV